MAGYKLFCFGNPILELDGQPVKLETRKSLALLVYLRINGLDFSRETLAALLWPEYDQQHAQANLRRTLASLHKYLRIDIIAADREKIGLRDSSRIWLDVEEFLDRLASRKAHPHPPEETCLECQSALESAIQLYRGDFMEGFNLSDCPDFDEWQFLQRESLRQELGIALQKMSEVYASLSLWKSAIDHARRWVGLDRLHEPAQRLLISLYAQAGQRSAALRQYEELARLLQEELGQAAEAETVNLFKKILIDSPAAGDAIAREFPQQRAFPRAVEPLLKTKLYLPISRGEKVQRNELAHKLDRIKEHALTLISAPAGFGKTTALIEWLSQNSLPAGWVSLDTGDNDPTRLLAYLIAALESAHGEAGNEARILLLSPQIAPPQFILATLIHTLEEAVTEPYVLVLDDYQVITDQAAHDVIAFLVDHQPANMHLVLSTRADPPLALARLRSRGQLLEIRTDDLRFTVDEAAQFLNKIMGLKLTRPDILALDGRIEGWVVGLQMAAISLRGRADIASTIQEFSGSNRYVLDYLVEEVIDRQTEQIQRFLLRTSILEKVCGLLCDHVLQMDRQEWQAESRVFSNMQTSQAILEYLDRSNLFLIPLDDERRWYRYHHLFAELLRARLKGYYPDQEKILHTRAAEWYESNHIASDAIWHALTAKDVDRAARLIEENALEASGNGEFATVLSWIQALPSECLQDRPWLCIRYAWAILQSGGLEGVDDLIEQAETWLQDQPNRISDQAFQDDQNLHHELLTLRVTTASLRDDHVHTIALALQALDRLPENQAHRRVNVMFALGNAYYITGDLSKAHQVYQEAKNLAEETNFLVRIILASNKLAHIQQVLGRLHDAYEIFQQTLDFAKSLGKPGFLGMGFIYCGIGEVLYEWNRTGEALDKIAEGVRIDELAGVPSMLANSYTVYARLLVMQGELDAAEALLQKTEQFIHKYPILPETIEMNQACWVKVWLAQGDLAKASEWAAERQSRWLHTAEDSRSPSFARELGEMARARILLYQGKLEDASMLLSNLAEAAHAAGRNGRLIEILVLQALAAQTQGQEDEAFRYLEKSLRLGEAEEYLRVFADEGKPLETLLRAGLERKLWNDPRRLKYLERLLTAFQTPNLTS